MNREMLERLAANPHYKMSPRQLQELRKLRAADNPVQHSQEVPKHSTSFAKHDTEPRKDDNVQPN